MQLLMALMTRARVARCQAALTGEHRAIAFSAAPGAGAVGFNPLGRTQSERVSQWRENSLELQLRTSLVASILFWEAS